MRAGRTILVVVAVAAVAIACLGDDAATLPGMSDAIEGGAPDASDAATVCDDRTFCDDKCGAQLKDACGVVRDCSAPCGDGLKCDGVRCVCASALTWCVGRCGGTKDNCGRELDCGVGSCDGGGCDSVTNTCAGCVPEPTVQTCGAAQCGFRKNNCGQQVDCGTCANGASCNENICCDPISVTCTGRQCGPAKANCGLIRSCGSCAPGVLCNGAGRCPDR